MIVFHFSGQLSRRRVRSRILVSHRMLIFLFGLPNDIIIHPSSSGMYMKHESIVVAGGSTVAAGF